MKKEEEKMKFQIDNILPRRPINFAAHQSVKMHNSSKSIIITMSATSDHTLKVVKEFLHAFTNG